MSILIVGNIIKDVYLNLDTRTENFETDQHGTKWLDFAFNTSEHHYFNRNSTLAGAAVSLEVLTKLNLKASITNSDLKYTDEGFTPNGPANTYRYILLADNNVSYLVPTAYHTTTFATPTDAYDYLYIDRSASLTPADINKILAYLDISKNTKLILYLRDSSNQELNRLLPYTHLIFLEQSTDSEAPNNLNPQKIVYLSEKQLTCQGISESISINRINTFTHLSIYSIAAATILGSFVLGKTIEESLRLARTNLENSKLNSTLTLDELQAAATTTPADHSELIAKNLLLSPKGILAADESGGSIHKKFNQLNIEDTYDNRRDYRNIFFTTPGIENYINGIILFDETARQLSDTGQNFVDYLTSKRIIPGIKVDHGLAPLKPNSLETITKGLDNLENRLQEYYQMGLRFAKWRAAFEIRLNNQGDILTPTDAAIEANCKALAEYAKKCQAANIVPIVEPEVVYDGYYDIEKSSLVTGKILDQLFDALKFANVNLKACILKVNMVLAGKQYDTQSTPAEIGQATADTLKNHVPADLAGVVFLSGGQTPEQATNNLAAIVNHGPFPWPITFSFARALQDPALYAWNGNNINIEKARQAFLDRLIANQKALVI
ncbi:fructose-bisphosphate aldolase class I [Candidatus Saccharibacteria bacterium]|nr:fructose-bisphosphate aldolase class I [Candidatus Saccharibacteria bacterium]